MYFVVKTFLDTIYLEDTICAPATAVGGAVAMLRLSGAESVAVASRLWRGRCGLAELPPRVLTLGKLCQASGEVIDQECLAVHCTGSGILAKMSLNCLPGGALCAQRHAPGGGRLPTGRSRRIQQACFEWPYGFDPGRGGRDLIRAGSGSVQLANRQLMATSGGR